MGLPRRSLVTFFGLGKKGYTRKTALLSAGYQTFKEWNDKVGRGLGRRAPIVLETAILRAGFLKNVKFKTVPSSIEVYYKMAYLHIELTDYGGIAQSMG